MAHTAVWQRNNVIRNTLGFFKDIGSRIGHDDCAGLAAEMAYHFMLTFMPILIFLVSLFGLISADSGIFTTMLSELRRVVPGDVFNILETSLLKVIKDSSANLALLSLLGALWTGSNAAIVIMKGINRAYRCTDERRNFFQQRLTAFLIVIGLAVILLLCSNLLVFGGLLLEFINTYVPLGHNTVLQINALRWIIGLGALFFVIVWIYGLAPDKHDPPRSKISRSWVGALVFIGLWLSLSWLFSLYVANMGRYSEVYGPLGAVVVLMIWLYLTSFILLVGAEINAWRTDCEKR